MSFINRLKHGCYVLNLMKIGTLKFVLKFYKIVYIPILDLILPNKLVCLAFSYSRHILFKTCTNGIFNDIRLHKFRAVNYIILCFVTIHNMLSYIDCINWAFRLKKIQKRHKTEISFRPASHFLCKLHTFYLKHKNFKIKFDWKLDSNLTRFKKSVATMTWKV